MTATSVAFFRNLTVGQRRSPTRDQLLDAFAAEGATHVQKHVERRSNGTPVIEWRLGVRATSRGTGTVQRLLAASGRADYAATRRTGP